MPHGTVAQLGFGAYRFSIEWSRIEPEDGEFSAAALDHYRRMIAACHEQGVQPVVTFHHFTTPRLGGAGRRLGRTRRSSTASRASASAPSPHLGDLIAIGCTINEPNVVSLDRLPARRRSRPASATTGAYRHGERQPHRARTASRTTRSRRGPGDFPVGLTLSMDELAAEPGGDARRWRRARHRAWRTVSSKRRAATTSSACRRTRASGSVPTGCRSGPRTASSSCRRWATSSGRRRSRPRSARPPRSRDARLRHRERARHRRRRPAHRVRHRGARRRRPLPRRRARRARLLLLVAARQLRVGARVRPRSGSSRSTARRSCARRSRRPRGSARSPGRTASTLTSDATLLTTSARYACSPAADAEMGRWRPSWNAGTILVVDDEPNIADLVELYLRREGYRVVKAGDRDEAALAGGRASTGPGSSCSTSGCPTSTGSRCAGDSAPTSADPGDLPHRPRQRGRPRARPRARRRRLRHEAVLARRARRAGEGRAAARRRRRRRRGRAGRRRRPSTSAGARSASPTTPVDVHHARSSTCCGSSPSGPASRCAASRSSTACGATTGTATRAPSTCTSRRCARRSTTPSRSHRARRRVPAGVVTPSSGQPALKPPAAPPRHSPLRRDARDRVRRARPQRCRHGCALPPDRHRLRPSRPARQGAHGERLRPAALGVPFAQPHRRGVGQPTRRLGRNLRSSSRTRSRRRRECRAGDPDG